MKTALGLALLLVPLTGWGQTNGWRWLTGGNLKAVKFIGQKGWIIGDDGNQGIILHTTNGGDTWAIQPHNTGRHYFRGLSVIDSLNGWIAGGLLGTGEPGFILRTRNGGQTWIEEYTRPGMHLNDIDYVDSLHGWFTGSFPTADSIYRTTNGGITWQAGNINRAGWGPIDFVDSLRGFTSSGDRVAKTTDGGLTWADTILFGFGTTHYIDMVDSLEGWMVEAAGGARHTTDGWRSWTIQPIPSSSGYYGLSFINNQVGYAVGGSSPAFGTIARTTNGGLTWSADSGYISIEAFHGVDATAINSAQAVGGGGALLKTTDAGNMWSVIRNVDIAGSLLNVSFWNNNQGWAVGTYGVITHTTNGGTVWQLQNSGTTAFFWGVDFPGSQKGWVCGESGLIINTTNGGTTWAPQASNTTMPLFSIDFQDTNTLVGVAVGGYYGPEPPITGIHGTIDNHGLHGLHGLRHTTDFTDNDTLQPWGTGYDFWKWPWNPQITQTSYRAIIRTTNGGALWIAQNTTGQVPLYGVSFATQREGWTCGDPQGGMGVILHTTDSGATWQGQNSNVTQGLYWIQFRNSQTGWCVGSGGTALWTTDGGATWNQGNTGTTSALWSCTFYDNLNGFACGNNGLLIKTVDGGRNWTPDTSKVYANLTAVTALDSLHAWSVGSYGMVLGWREAGVSGVEQRGPDKDRDFASLNRIKAYPNPFVSFARVAGHEKDKFALYDVTGRRVGTYKGDKIGADATTGIYFLITEGKEAGPTRIVKIK
jgi:photosystem II stability/assembly factor-like uncharacterized protein